MSKSCETRLDSRLSLCADYVRNGSKLADIGTDHAYLPVWLCRIGRCQSAIAADINSEPLKRGSATIIEAGLDSVITTRLSDGLKMIDDNEADDIVIAGMGGELIAKILGDWQFAKNSDKHFILQPMTKSEELIKWLCQNGFKILQQDCCIAAKKCYTVLLAAYCGEVIHTDELFPYIGILRPHKNPTHLQFINAHIARLRNQANADVCFAVLADKLEAATKQ